MRVLGPVEVLDDEGRPCPLAPKARQLLVVLSLRAPAAVDVDDLAELLWDDPPPAATKTIQAHVSRLRTALGSTATIERTGVGYVLRTVAGASDLDALGAHRAAARRWRAEGRPDDAADELAAARALWRGSLELPGAAAARGLVARGEADHRSLVDEHLAAVVDGAHPADAVAELQQLTATDPADEKRWALLVRALHRSGDARGALRAFQVARDALAEVGLEPGSALRAAESEVLGAPATPPSTPTSTPTPALASTPTPAPAANPPPAAVDPGRVRVPADVRYADTGAGRVAFVVFGDGPVGTVVLNPGLLSIDGIAHEPRLAAGVDRLAAASGAVVCLDRRGIGLSDPVVGADTDPPSVDDWAADVVAVVDAVGTQPPTGSTGTTDSIGTVGSTGRADAAGAATVVFACSDSALVALTVAAAHPERVRGLVLVHGYSRYSRGEGYPYGVDPDTAVATSADVLDVTATVPAFDPIAHIAPSVAGDPAFRRWFDDVGRRAASPHVATALHRSILDADVRDVLPRVRAPVLLLHRRSCASVDIGHARYLRDHLPQAELVVLPGADELWFVGDADALLDEVDRWRASI